jgi:hypothetical protein
MALVVIGRSYRLIGREVGLSKNTRCRDRQTTSRQDGSDRATPTLRPVTRMLGPANFERFQTAALKSALGWDGSKIQVCIPRYCDFIR